MCRFLLLKSKTEIDPQPFLQAFARMCKESRTTDGDIQGDGWGIAWRQDGQWQAETSLAPIWEEAGAHARIPKTTALALHARSASFPNQKGILAYNQPYIDNSLCFVFNGSIRGVTLKKPLQGTIGAQKIFSLVREELLSQKTDQVLSTVRDTIRAHAARVEGLNIGLHTGDIISLLCDYTDHQEYFTLHYAQNDTLAIACSQVMSIENVTYDWKPLQKGEVKVL